MNMMISYQELVRTFPKNPTKEQAIACLDKELNRVTSGVISKPESEQLFNQDTSRALQDISRSELSSIYIQMNGPRRAALVNMVFQLGLTGVLKFRKMIQYLKVGNYEAVIPPKNQCMHK
ncbi:hypothetical protein CQA51_28890 [Klebsiella pneumoniae]|nr:hypothetical protein CQA51_28890 [Klebsiella pneumoniae]